MLRLIEHTEGTDERDAVSNKGHRSKREKQLSIHGREEHVSLYEVTRDPYKHTVREREHE